MTEIFNSYGGWVMLGLFGSLAFSLHLFLGKAENQPRPKWVPEWLWRFISPVRAPLLFNALLLLTLALWSNIDFDSQRQILMPLVSLGLAWLTGRLLSVLTDSSFGGWTIGIWCGFFSLLKTLPLGNNLLDLLNSKVISLPIGNASITPYSVLKTFFLLWIFFLLAGSIIRPVETYLIKRRDIKASNRNLMLQFLRVILYTAVVLFSLNILGVDLTTLTVFGGALGVGLGFGLQKITSNFISGVILLLEKSVEEDDLIELNDGTLGFIRKTSARYTLVETFDSKEIMVPNEDFITNRVTNWTYSNSKGRIELNVGVSYKSDIELARKLILDSAHSHPLCMDDPEPICYLADFGESSVNFILHFWISDITVGRLKPTDTVMTAIWHSFKENDIEIPFPQRDVHIKPPSEQGS